MLHFTIFSDDSKQDASTTAAHNKRIIELLQDRKLIFEDIGSIWENNYGCDRIKGYSIEQEFCMTILY